MEIDKWILKEDENMMQFGKINCPVCNQDKDALTVWLNMNGIAFCACDECIKMKLPVFDDSASKRYCHAILKVGFRAGYEKARQEMMDLLNKVD
jgi:transposase-like protein